MSNSTYSTPDPSDSAPDPSDPTPEIWPPAPTGPVVRADRDMPLTWTEHLAAAPPEMILFAVFAVTVSLGELCLTFAGPKLWRETLMPYTGGSLQTPYLFCLFFAYQAIFAPKTVPKSRFAIPMILLIGAMSGVAFYLVRPRVNYHNPYLTFSPWQPIWTVVLPLAWALVLIFVPILRRHFTPPIEQ